MKILNILIPFLVTMSLGFGSITVANTHDKIMDDASIQKAVKQKLHDDKTLAREVIVITTKDGVVILSGDLKSDADARNAVEKAQSVTGVSDVNTDKLTVKGKDNTEQLIKDAYITSKVKGVFLRDKLFGKEPISVRAIHVETKEGVVYLTGIVVDKATAENAVKFAKTVKDVTNVESSIQVKPK